MNQKMRNGIGNRCDFGTEKNFKIKVHGGYPSILTWWDRNTETEDKEDERMTCLVNREINI